MDRAQKQETVETLHSALKDTNLVVIAHYSGLTVAEITDLRRKMIGVGASFRVTKNRLAKLALKGTKYEKLEALFTGPTGITFANDPVSAAKVTTEYAKLNDKFVIVGGGFGEQVLTVNAIETLAKLPSLDELRAKIIGMIVTPATRLATLSQAPASQLARVIQAHATKQQAA